MLQAYDLHVDGLFTYCLSVLCEHEAAVAAVREVRDLVLRHGARLADAELLRAWLYSLARHCCLRRLGQGPGTQAAETPPGSGQTAERRRELASLAWPEAAGTTPEQREALELAVRHHLRPAEIAAVLGLSAEAAQGLLAAAGDEVGRTRAALLLLGVGSCPVLAQLGGVGAESWRGWVLGPALRRELVQHVVDCPTCRGTAERVAGEGGAAGLSGLADLSGLPMLAAPVTVRVGAAPSRSAHDSAGAAFLSGAAAGRRALRAEDATERLDLRFDRRGFPRHRASGPGRGQAVRQRVVTTGVLAAVLTAPVVALWVAHRGADRAEAVSAVRVDKPAPAGVGSPPAADPVRAATGALELAGTRTAETLLPPGKGAAVPAPPRGLAALSLGDHAAPRTDPAPGAAAGALTVEASDYAGRTVLTLTNSGGTTIQWHAVVDATWLRLSRDSGTLEPGQRITVTVTVDEDRTPQGHWTARIALPPSEAVVTLEGGPQHRGGQPTPPPAPPTAPPAASPTQGPSPTEPPATPPPPSSSPPPSSAPTPTPTSTPTATGSTPPAPPPSTSPGPTP